jgi:hypothetical protein
MSTVQLISEMYGVFFRSFAKDVEPFEAMFRQQNVYGTDMYVEVCL